MDDGKGFRELLRIDEKGGAVFGGRVCYGMPQSACPELTGEIQHYVPVRAKAPIIRKGKASTRINTIYGGNVRVS